MSLCMQCVHALQNLCREEHKTALLNADATIANLQYVNGNITNAVQVNHNYEKKSLSA